MKLGYFNANELFDPRGSASQTKGKFHDMFSYMLVKQARVDI